MKNTEVNFTRDGQEILSAIQNDPNLPYDTGWLKNHITLGCKELKDKKEIKIFLSGAEGKVPYAVYLQEGTGPHDIPHAFGYGTKRLPKANKYTGVEPFGVGGKFNGFFHPGSTKHKGFIENVLVANCINYYKSHYEVVNIIKFK